jgi:hypothetical protein
MDWQVSENGLRMNLTYRPAFDWSHEENHVKPQVRIARMLPWFQSGISAVCLLDRDVALNECAWYAGKDLAGRGSGLFKGTHSVFFWKNRRFGLCDVVSCRPVALRGWVATTYIGSFILAVPKYCMKLFTNSLRSSTHNLQEVVDRSDHSVNLSCTSWHLAWFFRVYLPPVALVRHQFKISRFPI